MPNLGRFNDSLDVLRQEYASLTGEFENARGIRDELEAKMSLQIKEMNSIRQALVDLEFQHNEVRRRYEEEISRLRSEVNHLRQAQQAQHPQASGGGPANGPPTITGPGGPGPNGSASHPPGGPPPSQQQPPSGPGGPHPPPSQGGPADHPSVGPGGPGPASLGGPGMGPGVIGPGMGGPPPRILDDYPMRGDRERERDRDRDREREREILRERERDRERDRDRDRERERMRGPGRERAGSSASAIGPGMGMGPGGPSHHGLPPPPGPGDMRDVHMRDVRDLDSKDRLREMRANEYERERMDRERERDRERDRMERDNERLMDPRDAKRMRGDPGLGQMGSPPHPGGRIIKDGRPDPYSPVLSTHPTPKLPPAPGSSGSSAPNSRALYGPPLPPGASPSNHPHMHPYGPGPDDNGPPPPNHLGGVSSMHKPIVPVPVSTGPGGPPPPPQQGAGGPPSAGPGGPNGNSASAPSTAGSSTITNGSDRDREREREWDRERGPIGLGAGPVGPGMGPGGSGPGQAGSSSSANTAIAAPDDLSLATVPLEYKKEGVDWFAVFNPKVKRVLDINLVHNLNHASVVCCVQFSSDGKFLATGCNRTAQIYDVKTGNKICVLVDEQAGKTGDLYIRSVRFSPDGKFLATGAEDRQIRIWDIAQKRIRHVFDGHQQEIYSLDFSQDGSLIISGSGDKTARIWNMTTYACRVFTISDADSLNNDAGVTSVAISPDNRYVAAGSLDTVVRVWEVATGQMVERLRGHRDSVYSVAFTPDGRGLVSGSLDKTLKYWDVTSLVSGGGSGKVKEIPSPGKDGVAPNASADDKSAVANGSGDRDRGGSTVATKDFIGHKDYVLSVAVSSDGRWIVSGSKDRCVQFWDAASATMQCMLQGHKNSVISLDLNPTGGMLATGSGDSLARIWSYAVI